MDRASIDAAVGAERLALADLVIDLDEQQWTTPSLCDAWTVRDVVAHLAGTTRNGVATIVAAALRAGGSFDRMEVDLAARRAGRFSTAELVRQLRASALTNRRTPGSSPMDPLMDLVIHGQDISRPLALPHSSPPEVVTACLEYVAGNRFLGGRRRVTGLRLAASDTGWSSGHGPTVRGTAVGLLLAVSGRPVGLTGLEGPGLPRLAARV